MNKNSLLYIGVFLAGAIITPLYLSLFTDNDGDRLNEVTEENSTFPEPENNSLVSEEQSNQVFVPRDSQEAIESDYAISPELRIPTSLPQYATNQPSIPGYPNYSAIPPVALSFPKQISNESAVMPQRPLSTGESLRTEDQAIAPKTTQSVPILGSTARSLSENIFTPPHTRPDPEAIAPEPFSTGNIAPAEFNLRNFATDDVDSE
ncbi:hypothetical protein [[Limnothrix rosea] IAM M-220]|uniref:hypothetical protein n=1 Tax=[Limnothrix rosea] IAM M-220 TaxID=454133 RepID=UPI0009624A26|nr:hypothetical protein [[Limnothrix rosea] IAM M-220]OKH17165.1 hypothetical protein NIES208_10155 [[Limnothrix rosea] IAM M-220]